MFYHAKNGSITLENTKMDYISFGNGTDILVMLPGLGDGITTVKGMALPLAMEYHAYAGRKKAAHLRSASPFDKFTVFMFSRKNPIPEGYTTRDMAADQAKAMELLGISPANVMGISQGGMIAQYLAIDHPDLVKKLVLAVTCSKASEETKSVLNNWIYLAEQGKYKELMIDTAEHSYSENYLKKYRRLYPVLGWIGKPKSFCRFLIQAKSCIQHNAASDLNKIKCPVLILGGDEDGIVGTQAAFQLSHNINESELYIYKGLGHAAYEEAKDFPERILDFLS